MDKAFPVLLIVHLSTPAAPPVIAKGSGLRRKSFGGAC